MATPCPTAAMTGTRPPAASTVARVTSAHSSGVRAKSSPVPLGETIAQIPASGSQRAFARTASRSTEPSAA